MKISALSFSILGVVMVAVLYSQISFSQSMVCSESKITTMNFRNTDNSDSTGTFSSKVLEIDENLTAFSVDGNSILMRSVNCPNKENGTIESLLDIKRVEQDDDIYEAVLRKKSRTEVYYIDYRGQFVTFSIISHSKMLLGGGGVAGVMLCQPLRSPNRDLAELCESLTLKGSE